ncbi:MAG: hypothetical protein F4164_13235 [Gemmatimonadales bacterium]|nr:hypothetical protein [Gemmatimonadales bacterium]MYG50296.1 hypothetical protein [Gemmatimonadales bacterium]MYK03152.1 hypothetical protein [Candidatus Palauibacter ramosifaciens]
MDDRVLTRKTLRRGRLRRQLLLPVVLACAYSPPPAVAQVREVVIDGDTVGVEGGVMAGVSAAALRANPDEYAGARLRWTVRFLSLERAEPERIDFYEGEPFLLARAPDPGDGLVYIAVPPELLEAAEKLRPLRPLDVLVKVRTGRSALLRVPILDLLALY